ncbi:hypothetical protein N7G274_005296 [Stereocaulon virgatum]|uniref:Non-homologous end-joining factor 1 n=1 Tax=Stereocaulon virgatum TaxID=373712 RepID=A0ABR4AAL2_9LECA
MYPTWRSLPIDFKDVVIPPLLIKTEFGLSSYKVWLTDLTHIWAESMDRRQIIQRTFSVDTSIDPSEDTSQLRLFLQSIEDALVQRTGTTVDIVQSDTKRHLTIQTWTPLPGPLKPLEWKIVLIPAAQSVFTVEFVIPLLSQQSTAKAEKASLLQQLTYKDNVISKLIDKMQSDGVDLSKVFPGVPHVRPGANARQIIGKSVKGLSEFDFEQWQSRIVRDGKSLEELKDLVSNVFDTDSQEIPGESQIQDSPDYGDWWKNLRYENSQRMPATSILPKDDTRESGAVADDPQIKLTPPRRQVKPGSCMETGLSEEEIDSRPTPAIQLAENGSTTDDSDFDVELSETAKVSPRTGTRPETGGTSTRKTRRMPLATEIEENGHGASAVLQNKYALSKLTDVSKTYDTSSESDDNRMDLDRKAIVGSKVTSNNKKVVQASNVPKVKARLGKVGGKVNAGNGSDSKGVACQSRSASSSQPQPNGKPEGNQGDWGKPIQTPESGRADQAIVQPENYSPPRESEQERANKKREQLKRELESKNHVAAKKKRKF